MRNIILTLSTMALLAGCTSKEEKALMQAYEKNKSYHQQLQKTEKTQLYDGNTTKALLTATYLNEQNVDKEHKPDEVFIVGIYIEEMEEESFDQEGYSLTLNGSVPKSIQELVADDPLLKHISFVSEWNYFYLITFPHTSKKSFKLIFESELYGKGELHFAKVAKYVLTKEAF
ncbi:hypothetical protein ACLHDG_06400 [Sulfurovum sp. CS9]|uniref:hypothetical protein n=1 Tax=Sulfurovum sp. CS9 TaxID=3391146 RepID=UPI0039EC9088